MLTPYEHCDGTVAGHLLENSALAVQTTPRISIAKRVAFMFAIVTVCLCFGTESGAGAGTECRCCLNALNLLMQQRGVSSAFIGGVKCVLCSITH